LKIKEKIMNYKILKLTLLVFLFALSLNAATFVVNSTNDGVDANIGDNVCQTATLGECTLRAAISEANFAAGFDSINFNISGAGVKTISPNSILPDIAQPLIIDGYSQPGARVNTALTTDNAVILIEIDGTNAGAGANGFVLTGTASGSTLCGLAINRFGRVGISLLEGDNNIISGNFIGTDATGLIDAGNGSVGIYSEFSAFSDGNLIGGTTPAARNIISGNGNAGIAFEFRGSNNIVQGNFIGLAADGTSVLSNNNYGVGFGSFTGGTVVGGDDDDDGVADGIVNARNYISGNTGNGIFIGGSGFGGITIRGNFIGTDTTGTLARPNNFGIATNAANSAIIGGTTNGAGNLISGNTGDGIGIGFTGNMSVHGNLIGTAADGISALPNTGDGIEIATSGGNNRIGGIGTNEGNLIAFNTEDGVQITDVGASPVNNPILSNSIFSNGGLGINLSVDGVTPNDAGDADTGGNNLQNFPVITAAQPGSTRVVGTLNSTPSTTFRLEFFNSPTADVSGNGEGQFFVGTIDVTTNAGGNVSFDQTFAYNSALNTFVSATATNIITGDTSEFSNAKQVLSPTAAQVSVRGRVLNTLGRGISSARVYITDRNGNIRQTGTNSFGYYNFVEIVAGETYVLTASHKRYQFAPQVLFITEDLSEINFIVSPSKY
jgi:CSLREA domain-containing protein